ncbi:hypothetical protein Tco_1021042 [Tanacetum coccineum]
MSSYNLRGCVKCGAGNSFVNDPNPNSFNDSPNFFNHPPQPQMHSCELCGNDAHYGYDCPPQVPLKPSIYYDDDDDDEEYSIQVSEFYKNSPIAITPVLPTVEPVDSLSMGDEHLSTILEKESNKVINSSVENLVLIPSESKDLTDYESECDMPVCDDSSSKNEGLDDIDPIPPGKEIDHLVAIRDSV